MPAILFPQTRPFREQHVFADALRRDCPVEVLDDWPAPTVWPSLLDAATRRRGDAWSAYSAGTGAQRFTEAIETVAFVADRGRRSRS